MLIIHISKSPLAGSPIRIVNAINKHTKHKARLINLSANAYGARTFPEDLIWEKDKELCINLIKSADILHFHHFIDLENNDFNINFKKISNNAKVIRHIHTEKNKLLEWNKLTENDLILDEYPKVVIPHCPERTYLNLPMLPNIIPIMDNKMTPQTTLNKKVKVAFSSSSNNSIFDERWETKGYKEVSKKLRKLSKKLNFEYIEIINMPYEKAMELKRESDIIIGDIVTGSYHLTELEGLSQGKVVLSYLDARSIQTFMNTFKTQEIPFVNVSLNYLENTLKELLRSKELRDDIGSFSRNWIENYYNDKILINEFIKFYDKVLSDKILSRENSNEFSKAKEFLYNDIFDLKWKKNKQEYEKFRFNKKNILRNILSLKKSKDKKLKILTILGIGFKFKIKPK